CMQNMQLPLTF
nr:immunoglobulin light chain junction region [Macaca mulatta]